MILTKWLPVAGFVVLLSGGLMSAQDTTPKPDEQPARYFRLDFVVKDVQDGRSFNTRSYFVYVTDRTKPYSRASIRATSKVNVEVGNQKNVNQYDVGVNIDCNNVSVDKESLALDINAKVDSLLTPDESSESHPVPIVRTNQWSASVLVPLRKSSMIFSSDDLASKRKMQIELTATPLAR